MAVTLDGVKVGNLERDNWLVKAMIDEKTPVASRIMELLPATPEHPHRRIVLEVMTGEDATAALAKSAKAKEAERAKTGSSVSQKRSRMAIGCLVAAAALFGFAVIGTFVNHPVPTAAPTNSGEANSPEVEAILAKERTLPRNDLDGRIALYQQLVKLAPMRTDFASALDTLWTQRHPTKPQPAYTLTAEELAAAYDANEVSAQQMYGNGPQTVTGTVQSINLDFRDKPFIVLKGINLFQGPQAKLSESSEGKAASLSKGEKIVLRCESISEVAGTPMLQNCDLR